MKFQNAIGNNKKKMTSRIMFDRSTESSQSTIQYNNVK